MIDARNKELYKAYKGLAAAYPNIHFGGRLGMFEYMDMDDAIIAAREMAGDLI